jgi:hypothetical protein
MTPHTTENGAEGAPPGTVRWSDAMAVIVQAVERNAHIKIAVWKQSYDLSCVNDCFRGQDMTDTVMEQLLEIALAARGALERYAPNAEGMDGILFGRFPHGTCGGTSELLGRYLIEAGYENVMYVCGNKHNEGSHAWVEVGEFILDITGDQFGQPAVVVTTASDWHDEWEQEGARPPICTREQWPMYPFGAWAAMKAGIDASRA